MRWKKEKYSENKKGHGKEKDDDEVVNEIIEYGRKKEEKRQSTKGRKMNGRENE